MKLLIVNYFNQRRYQFHMTQVNISQNEEKTKWENHENQVTKTKWRLHQETGALIYLK